MTIGLGSGSTVYWLLENLGKRVSKGLKVKGVPSSVKTEKLADKFGIPLTSFHDIQELDLAIDGADEVDDYLNLIKGGGGSLVREKIVIEASKHVIIIGDESKLVKGLGNRPLPIEVIRFGWEVTCRKITRVGAECSLRLEGSHPFISDNGNYILDCDFPTITHPASLHEQLTSLAGVVETGLFVNSADQVILGKENNIRFLERSK
ncbi:ribose-5-phosphate isomerase RpiA [Halobacillus salinarum]|uniref:Ribose 5-phosphate isomerase A n=2 Tax=Halobacillus salinarum TaxID=2932257 RepID=A0ABY4ES36_9BACI|nr:ribose-5-phosphate isomerase RpiA [Halobacillus salinarum]